MIVGSLHLTWNFSDCSVALWFVFLTHQQRLNCVDVIISMRIASAAARTPVDCSELHQQPADAVLRPTFVHKLCCKLSSIVTFTFIQIFDQNFGSFTEQHQSCCVCLIQRQNLRYYRCPVWKTKRKVDKKANVHENWNMQTLFYRLLNISAKYHQNRSLQFRAIPFQSWAVFW